MQDQDFQLHDLEPWDISEATDAFDAFQSSATFQNSRQKRKETNEIDRRWKSKIASEEDPTEILCRVARKQSEDTSGYYTHSKKIIEIEYKNVDPPVKPLELKHSLCFGKNHLLSAAHDIYGCFQDSKPKQVKNNTTKSSAGLNYLEGAADPNPIPFRPRSKGSEPAFMKKNIPRHKYERHPLVLARKHDSDESLRGLQALHEWRIQKAAAVESMKKLKSISPHSLSKRPLSSRSESTRRAVLENRAFVTAQKMFPLTTEEPVLKIKELMNQSNSISQNMDNIAAMVYQSSMSNDAKTATLYGDRALNATKNFAGKEAANLQALLSLSKQSFREAASIRRKSLPQLPSLSLSSSIRALAYQF